MKLYGYWRSSASWRVRIALAHKGLRCETVAVNLLKNEHETDRHRTVSPLGEVPVLEIDGQLLRQSVAILHYLEERYPSPPLLPTALLDRAYVREVVEVVNSGIHPLQNRRVLMKLETEQGFDEAKKKAWAAHFIARGFTGLETIIGARSGRCVLGDMLTMADLYVAPQIYNARRFGVDMTKFPTLSRLEKSLAAEPVIATTHPDAQPDAPTTA